MKAEEYIRTPTVDFYFYGRSNPLSTEAGGIRQLLELIERSAGGLVPNEMQIGKKVLPYDVEKAQQLIARVGVGNVDYLGLRRTSDLGVSYLFGFLGGAAPLGCRLKMSIAASYFQPKQVSESRAVEFFFFTLELCRAYDPVYGFAHNRADISLGSDPHPSHPFAAYEVYEVFWLNVYGPALVDAIGRERVRSVPCYRMETLPNGGIGWLTRPSPDDFASDAARSAQARAFVHLRPDSDFEEVRQRLQERSAKLAPVEQDWDPDIQDVLELTLDDVLIADRPQQTAKLNQYRPPEVTEWRPASEALPADVEDVEEEIDRYGSFCAEHLVAILHKDIPEVMKFSPVALPRIDYHFWHFDYPRTFKREDIENDLIPALGAYLGEMLVENLGGRWIPRRAMEESQVLVGSRAWLPFLRAKRYFQSAQSALDYSVTKFYRSAERHREPS